MIKLEVSWKGKDFDQLTRYIDELNMAAFETEVMGMAEDAVEDVRKYIKDTKKRPDKGSHALENAIEAKVLNTEATKAGGVEDIGIGNMTTIIQEAPYWNILDRGGMIPAHRVPTGGFYPGEAKPNPASFRQASDWIAGDDKYSFMARTVIEGTNWIGHLYDYLDKHLNKIITDLGGKIIDGMGR